MLASAGDLPRGRLVWEPKWDGYRCSCAVDGQARTLRVLTRSGRSVGAALPELGGLCDALAGRRVLLDGELVVGDGSPASFYRLGGRLGVSKPASIDMAATRTPVTLVLFDVLWAEGQLLVNRPYLERRAALESLALAGPHWVTTPTYDDGDALLAACEDVGVEGGVAKLAASRYVSGRSRAWVKRKCHGWRAEHAPRRRPGSQLRTTEISRA